MQRPSIEIPDVITAQVSYGWDVVERRTRMCNHAQKERNVIELCTYSRGVWRLRKEVKKMVKYASYWDASNWHSYVEVLNLQDQRADYRIIVYDRDGSVCWQDTRTLTPHEAERIFINRHVPEGDRREGLVVVEPVREGDEFPSVLVIYAEGQHWKEGIRFVPFTRVP